ncbi:MAG TPA: hypothetical protein VG815_02360 [Chloroflexota bacterium]|nr:hypothetical protein [Chloroflexota bacterium]
MANSLGDQDSSSIQGRDPGLQADVDDLEAAAGGRTTPSRLVVATHL